MNYTKQKPTQPLYYWWRLNSIDEPFILLINYSGRIFSLGEEAVTYLRDVIEKGEWLGPIEMPKE
jgi:hypothetical protein